MADHVIVDEQVHFKYEKEILKYLVYFNRICYIYNLLSQESVPTFYFHSFLLKSLSCICVPVFITTYFHSNRQHRYNHWQFHFKVIVTKKWSGLQSWKLGTHRKARKVLPLDVNSLLVLSKEQRKHNIILCI